VGADRALAWYREAMRLWRRGPGTFALLAIIVLVVDFGVGLVPIVGVLVAQLLLPLTACGMLYASLAADRDDRPRVAHVLAVIGASPRAIVAVVLSGVVVFAAESLAAFAFGDINMLLPIGNDTPASPATILAIYTVGIAVSLPLTFVPFGALFDGLGVVDSFAQSYHAFARNVAPLALYGALSLVLLLFGWATYGLGLVLALPWWAASSYAAWKDVFAVDRDRIAPAAAT
jgi:uncharacterized membrane protein